MCYSAQVIHEYRLFTREYGAVLSLKEFFDIYWGSSQNSDRKVRQAPADGRSGLNLPAPILARTRRVPMHLRAPRRAAIALAGSASGHLRTVWNCA